MSLVFDYLRCISVVDAPSGDVIYLYHVVLMLLHWFLLKCVVLFVFFIVVVIVVVAIFLSVNADVEIIDNKVVMYNSVGA